MSTQQLEQVKQLQAIVNKMEVTLGAIADAVVWVGEDRLIQWCNSRFESLVNQPHVTVCGAKLTDLLPLAQVGQPVARVWSFRDITQRQRAEAALRQSELQYRSIFEAINDGLFITEIETEKVAEVNPAACQMHGYSYEEFLALYPSVYIHPDSHSVFLEFVEKTRAGEQFYGQAVDICKDGSLIDVEVKGTTCIYNGKRHILAIVRDITARKRTEEALRQSEAQYRDLVQTANCIILRWDGNGDIIFLNDYGQRLFGFDIDEITGSNVIGTIVPETETSGRDLQILMVDICQQPENYLFNENENLCKNGDRVWIVWANKPILDAQGNLIEILSVGTDATERKRAEAALQESELKFRSIVENANDLIFVLSPEGIFTYHSPNVTAIMGYSLEEIEGHSVVEFTKPEDLAISASALQRAITGEKLTNIEVRLRHQDGGWRWFNFNTSTINTPNGEIAIAGVGRDITERKQAEAALQRRTQAESLISSISRQFIDQDLATAINFTLRAIAQFIDAEHSCIFECSQDKREFNLIHEWCGEDVAPLIDIAKGSPVEVFPYFYEPVLRGKHRQISSVEDLPLHLPERKLFESMSFQSILAVPMVHAGKVVGFVGAAIIHYSKTWNQEDINLLKLVGEIIAIGRARHQAEEALRIAKEAAETANRAKSAFLANMSHELRTPLNAILGFSQLMERDTSLNSNQRESLATINRSGEHLLNLINDVLEMSKIEAGQIIFNPEDFDLYLLLQTLQEMFQVRTQAKQLFLRFEMAPNLPRYIQTDEGKLRQVLINLLGNAVKFTQSGGVTLRVRLGSGDWGLGSGDWGLGSGDWGLGTDENKGISGQGGQERIIEEVSPLSLPNSQSLIPNPQLPMPNAQSLFFEIQDTGRGIAAEEMNNLFQPFVQTTSGIQTKEGTGLGLTISRQFVRLLGGDIHLTSSLGQGATFSFDIQVNLAAALKAAPKLNKGRVLKLAANQPSYRILVVDDRKENRDLIVQLLGSIGFEIQAANNGQEAIAIWQTWQPHLIWMDMRMPVINGYDATKEIRAREKNTTTNFRTVIIALTASAFEEQQASILAAGCDDLVRKPFREQVIFEKIAEYLQVRYICAEESNEDVTDKNLENTQSSILDLRSAITIMPAQWLIELNQAAVEVDAERILQLIEQIPQTHSALTEKLANLVRNFCFDEIIDLTEENIQL
ncbi:PAS domain S-box protein [Nostoc sp.]|uniref:PAS domain S-box protein n=1 Tax=Nostoc sp. TaxID=1180 RepID=UPI002FF48039